MCPQVQVTTGSGSSTQFLQVTPATVSSSGQHQQATVTVPASLVTASALRATPTSNQHATSTPTQISLVSTPPSTQATIATVQVGRPL